MSEKRFVYIDHIRIILTGIVILHHLLITYGAPGGWYYREFELTQLDLPTLTLLVLVTVGNQAYFMGFFFFLSGYFSVNALLKKGQVTYLLQRILRLGLPLLFYVYLISPLLRLSLRSILYHQDFSLENMRTIYTQLRFGLELGPMWFLLLLLIFSFLLLPWTTLTNKFSIQPHTISGRQILLIALITGLLTFFIRIPFPIGYVYQPLNLQIPYLLQYSILYFLGVLAYKGKWLDKIPEIQFRSWLILALGMAGLMPILFFLSGGTQGDVGPALGGFHWQSLALSVWEQIFCTSVILILLFVFRTKTDSPTKITNELAASAYTAFLIHPLILVILTTSLHKITLHPLIKISTLAIPSLILCFLVAGFFRRLPGFKAVL
ncbi:MAG: acyltransferase [Anaerolineales bacterium]|nr:acyltransferase [Anaerolineales bacterium]